MNPIFEWSDFGSLLYIGYPDTRNQGLREYRAIPVQWISELWASLVFKWSKSVRLSNAPITEAPLKYQTSNLLLLLLLMLMFILFFFSV